ncbi:MAG: CHAT domain-containing protein [Actinomycetota bacterium]|nr:CHAT domain-containing protein [Actinomycetota bacterium]
MAGVEADAPLTTVLDEAEQLMDDDPVTAGGLAAAVRARVSSDATPDATFATVAARAALLEGQALAIGGRLDDALRAVDAARDAFDEADEPWLALRTDLGRMHILNELGRTAAAVQVGRRLLQGIDALEGADAQTGSLPFAVDWLRASCLGNLGICHTFAGDYAAATMATAAAERHLLALGRMDEIAILRHNQAELLLEEGRAAQAQDMFARAASGFADAGLALLEARCLADLGRAQVALGEAVPALAAFGRAERLLDRLGAQAETEQLRLHTAQAYLALNLYDEAALVYEQVAATAADAGLAHYHALALAGQGAALAALHRWEDARTSLASAARLFDSVGNLPLATAARVELAAVLDHCGDRDGGLGLLRELRLATGAHQHRLARVYVLLGLADVTRSDEAARALVEAADLVDELALPPLRFRVDSRLGALRRRQGRLAEAHQLLSRAADEADEQRALLPSQLTRTSFLRDKSRTFDELVALHLDLSPQAPELAYLAAERAKGRVLLDRLTGGAGANRRDREPGRAEPSLVAELSAVYDELLGAGTTGSETTGRRRLDELRRRADQLQARVSVAGIAGGVDRGEALGTAPLLGYESLKSRLADGTVLVAYHVVGDDVIGFLGAGSGLVGRRVTTLRRLAPLLAALEEHWRRFRVGAAFVQRHAARLAVLVERDLNLLAGELLGDLPLPAPTGGTDRLAVVLPPALHGVPFHALPVGDRPLVADWEVVTGPSGSVLGSLPPWTCDASRPSVALATTDSTIPHAEAEVRALSTLLPNARLRIGSDATVAALRRDSARAGIVHLACHGMFRPDNGVFSALRLADGWFTAVDAVALDVTGALVTLSACETGRQQAVGGEAVGLPRAFLAAGAAAVVSSLWMADDRATSAQMCDFYGHLRQGLTPTGALRQAQLDSARRDPHPYYWAPFTVTGAC